MAASPTFGRLKRRTTEASFEGGALSSDGGPMRVREVDREIGLSGAVAAVLHEPRDRHADASKLGGYFTLN